MTRAGWTGLVFVAVGLMASSLWPLQAKPAEQHRVSGAELYERYCALCHGDDRQGYAADHAPSLRSPELWGGGGGSFLWQAIAYGRPGTPMAAFAAEQGGPLGHEEQHILYDWLATAAGARQARLSKKPVVGDVVLGAELYGTHCASCHGDRGQGGTGTALANPVFLATASDAFLRYTIAKGRSGTPMVGFAGRLKSQELDAVVSFLRTRATGWEKPAPVRVEPPDASMAVLNPKAEPATLVHREGRFVSAASVAAALERGERMVLLDARPMSDWQRSHIPGALPMPYYDGVDELVPHLPTDDTPVVAYCACPHAASGKVVDALREKGFDNARILDEGVLHWAAQGYPVELGGPAR